MKSKLLSLVFAVVLLSSCASVDPSSLPMGMTEQEFKGKSKNIMLYKSSADQAIYRFDTPDGSWRYAFFKDGKLVKIDVREE